MSLDDPIRLYVVHDDRDTIPTRIREIIGVHRFSLLLRRQKTLGGMIEESVRAVTGAGFATVASDTEAADFCKTLAAVQGDPMVMRLPSMLAPDDFDAFRSVLGKCAYAFEPLIVGGVHDGEAVTVTPRKTVEALLTAPPGEARAALLRGVAEGADRLGHIDFLDLREISEFLKYMTAATETRHFNSAAIRDGVFRKRSSDVGKMRAEHDFFHVAPAQMKRFLLPTFDFCEEPDGASYAMEHCMVPDAALQFVHGAFGQKSFGALLDGFFCYLAARPVHEVSNVIFQREAQALTWGKVEARLDVLRKVPEGQALDRLLTTSCAMGGLDAICSRAEPLVRKAVETDSEFILTFSHRDPCLSNILFDRRISFFRLIDPRGATTYDDALAPPLYDVAKMSHSILGGYDFINNGRFEVCLDDRMSLTLRLDGNGPFNWSKMLFLNRLKGAGLDWRRVRAYELSLFLSMLPLHLDTPRKLPAFVLTAVDIIEQLEATS